MAQAKKVIQDELKTNWQSDQSPLTLTNAETNKIDEMFWNSAKCDSMELRHMLFRLNYNNIQGNQTLTQFLEKYVAPLQEKCRFWYAYG